MNHRTVLLANHRRAFTLIELLTVIAIIGILAAIIIPVVGRVRDQARQAQSASNLRQWGIATQLYVAENRNLLPLRGLTNANVDRPTWAQVAQAEAQFAWYNALPPFVSERPLSELSELNQRSRLYSDDSIHRNPRARFTEERQVLDRPAFSYAWNSQLNNSRSETAANTLDVRVRQPITRFTDPSRTVLFIEGWSNNNDRGPNLNTSQTENVDSGRAYGRAQHIAHLGGTTRIAFLDGSVRGFRANEIDRGTASENSVVFFAGMP